MFEQSIASEAAFATGHNFLQLMSWFFSLGSSKRSLCLDVWDRFLTCIGCVPTSEDQQQSSSKEFLGDEQVGNGWTCGKEDISSDHSDI